MKFQRMFAKIKHLIITQTDLDSKTLFKLLDIMYQCLSNTEIEKYNLLLKDLYEWKTIQKSLTKCIKEYEINNLENELELLKISINL
ncbi:unnamed protein product [marine sediment metagenome]|uniref:Uncharacterized protein n=1 Tax=marine sediment metagenome TaxID=412755 RepID=X0RW26_9ZZZZ